MMNNKNWKDRFFNYLDNIIFWKRFEEHISRNRDRYEGFFLISTLLIFACLMVSESAHFDKDRAEQLIIEAKMGFIIAQYNASDGSVRHCWVTHRKEWVELTGESASIPIDDMHGAEVSKLASSIGISNLDSCTKWYGK